MSELPVPEKCPNCGAGPSGTFEYDWKCGSRLRQFLSPGMLDESANCVRRQLAAAAEELECLRRTSREHWSRLEDITRRIGVARNPTEIKEELEREIRVYERRIGSIVLG